MIKKNYLYGCSMIAKSEKLKADVENNKADAIRKLAQTLDNNSIRETKARNRVDISLERYEYMKEQLDLLKAENSYFRALFEKIKLPIDKNIDENSVAVEHCYHPSRFRTMYVIRFETDD